MAGDAGDLAYVHGRLVQARGAQALPERGHERGVVQRAVSDNCGVDTLVGLVDLVLDYARRLDHDCAHDERVDGDGTVAEDLVGASIDDRTKVRVADGRVAGEA